MKVYLLLWNSRSEYAEVIGICPSDAAARARAEGIHSTHLDSRPLRWVHHPADEQEGEAEHWIAECGVVDQYEVHAMPVAATSDMVKAALASLSPGLRAEAMEDYHHCGEERPCACDYDE